MTTVNVTANASLGIPPDVTSISWDTAATDNTPTFTVTPSGGNVGDTLYIQIASDSGFNTVVYSASTSVTSGILSSGWEHTMTDALDDGPYYRRARQSRTSPLGKVRYSDWTSPGGVVTIDTGGSAGAPIVADVGGDIGRYTVSGVTIFRPTNTGDPITGEGSGNSITGTNSTHFSIASDGSIATTAAFVTAQGSGLISSYSLSVTVSNATGSDTFTWTPDVEDNAADIETSSQLQTAVYAAKTRNAAGDHKVYLQDGVYGSYSNTVLLTSGAIFSGSMVNGNDGLFTESGYDRNDVAAISGGSCTIEARNAGSAFWSGFLSLLGCNGIIFDGVVFNRHLTSDRTSPGANQADYSLSIGSNGTFTTEPDVIIRNCSFGFNYSADGTTRKAINGILTTRANYVIIEDCQTDGMLYGFKMNGCNKWAIRRTVFRHSITDDIIAYGNSTITASESQFQISDVVHFDQIWDAFFAAFHPDFVQIGTFTDRKDTTFFVGWCYSLGANQGFYVDDQLGPWIEGKGYIYTNEYCTNSDAGYDSGALHLFKRTATGGTLIAAADNEPGVGASWATYWTDEGTIGFTKVNADGKLYRCFVSPWAWAAITTGFGTVLVEKCTIISDPYRSDGLDYARVTAGHEGGTTLVDVIYEELFEQSWSSFAAVTNCLQVDKAAVETYFTGPFTTQASGPGLSTDWTTVTAAQAKSAIDAAYTPLSGNTDKGHMAV